MSIARKMFNAVGYEETKLDEIAEQAELSPVTLYNYFGSKAGLLLAIQTEYDDGLFERIAPVIVNPPTDVKAAVAEFFKVVIDHALETMNRDVWKHTWAHLFIEVGPEISQGFAENDRRLIDQLKTMLDVIQQRGELPAAVNTLDLANVLYSVQLIRAMQFMSEHLATREQFEELLHRECDFVLAACLGSPAAS